MCRMFFIGADRELPTKAKDPGKASFFVYREEHPEPDVEKHLRAKYVYYAGSHDGCGCGFGYESTQKFEEWISEDIPEDVRAVCRKDRLERIACMNELREYLNEVTVEGPVKLLVIWAGEESCIEHSQTVSPSYFGGDECFLPKNSLFDIRQP